MNDTDNLAAEAAKELQKFRFKSAIEKETRWRDNKINDLETQLRIEREMHEKTRAAHASEQEFIQCPSCGWHPVRKHASEQGALCENTFYDCRELTRKERNDGIAIIKSAVEKAIKAHDKEQHYYAALGEQESRAACASDIPDLYDRLCEMLKCPRDAEALLEAVGRLQRPTPATASEAHSTDQIAAEPAKELQKFIEKLVGFSVPLYELESRFKSAIKEATHSYEQAATDNADWFDQLVNDCADLLECEKEPVAILEKLKFRNDERVKHEAHQSERKTVHQWLNDCGITQEEMGKRICLLRRLRIVCDLLESESSTEKAWNARHPNLVRAAHASEQGAEAIELLGSVHRWFMEKAPEHYNGCGLWLDVDDFLKESQRPTPATERKGRNMSELKHEIDEQEHCERCGEDWPTLGSPCVAPATASEQGAERFHGIWRRTSREGYKAADNQGKVCGKFNDPMKNNAWVYFVWEPERPTPATASEQGAERELLQQALDALTEWQRLYGIVGLDPTLRNKMKNHAADLTREAVVALKKSLSQRPTPATEVT